MSFQIIEIKGIQYIKTHDIEQFICNPSWDGKMGLPYLFYSQENFKWVKINSQFTILYSHYPQEPNNISIWAYRKINWSNFLGCRRYPEEHFFSCLKRFWDGWGLFELKEKDLFSVYFLIPLDDIHWDVEFSPYDDLVEYNYDNSIFLKLVKENENFEEEKVLDLAENILLKIAPIPEQDDFPEFDLDNFVGMGKVIIQEKTPKPLAYSEDKSFTEWNGLYFRSKAEVKVAKELEKRKITFFPNAGCRIKNKNGIMVTKEPDFLVFYKGKFGIIELDGRTHNNRADIDHERIRMFKSQGILVFEHFNVDEEPSQIVDEFLAILENS